MERLRRFSKVLIHTELLLWGIYKMQVSNLLPPKMQVSGSDLPMTELKSCRPKPRELCTGHASRCFWCEVRGKGSVMGQITMETALRRDNDVMRTHSIVGLILNIAYSSPLPFFPLALEFPTTTLNLLCITGWFWIPDPPNSISWVLRLQIGPLTYFISVAMMQHYNQK